MLFLFPMSYILWWSWIKKEWMNEYTFLFCSKFFTFTLLILEAVNLNNPCGLSLFLHHFEFTLWILFYVYCIFISKSYAKTFTLSFCFCVMEKILNWIESKLRVSFLFCHGCEFMLLVLTLNCQHRRNWSGGGNCFGNSRGQSVRLVLV